MFPIIQPGGAVSAFSGRILPEYEDEGEDRRAAKYVNSPESLLFKKSRTLFGLHLAGRAAKEKGRIILVEGNVDVVSLHQRGYAETVAPLGTALTDEQCRILSRFTDTVYICFDGDRAGMKAAFAALPLLLEAEMDVRVVPLSEGEDPDSVSPERMKTPAGGPVSGPGVVFEANGRRWRHPIDRGEIAGTALSRADAPHHPTKRCTGRLRSLGLELARDPSAPNLGRHRRESNCESS